MAAGRDSSSVDLQCEQVAHVASLTVTIGEALIVAGNEMVRFASARIRDTVQAQHELLAWRTLDDAQRIWPELWERMAGEYTAEIAKLVEVSGEAVSAAVSKQMNANSNFPADAWSDERPRGTGKRKE